MSGNQNAHTPSHCDNQLLILTVAQLSPWMSRYSLRDAGCPAALEDFEAGNASVSYLRDLVFDVVKLDGSLKMSIQECSRSRQILLGLINLFHAAGALCVAEHVETEGQLALLEAIGRDLVQVFNLGRPGSSGDLAGLPRCEGLAASSCKSGYHQC